MNHRYFKSFRGPLKFFAICLFILCMIGAFFSLESSEVQGMAYRLLLNFEKNMSAVNLAAIYTASTEPDMEYVSIGEGMRKEEIAERFAERLDWNDTETETFGEMLMCSLNSNEGYLFPGGYAVPQSATPMDVKNMMLERFKETRDEELSEMFSKSSISLETALTVASLIQREASGKRDMKLISGIIWNRIFSDMTLDIDATLQYMKGSEDRWWPQVKSQDKFIASPYNTYINKGLPPGPISNPGLAAISAALNPEKTSCIFYLHDEYGRIHCSRTYSEHKRNVNIFLK